MDTPSFEPLPGYVPSGNGSSSDGAATYFAPAVRDTDAEFYQKSAVVRDAPMLEEVLRAMPYMVMVLNSNRQIVAANEAMLSMFRATLGEVTQKRPGEAFGCIRAKDGPSGCGTSRHCATCGAMQALLESQVANAKVVHECRIIVQKPGGLAPVDLRITVSPFHVAETPFILTAVEDISQDKRLGTLQRAIFYDVLNTAGCIDGYVQYLKVDGTTDQEVCEHLVQLSAQLIESIYVQRDLVLAESGALETHPVPIRASAILEEVKTQYASHSIGKDRTIELCEVWDGVMIADRRLLQRVLGNMIRNALEATRPGGTVTAGCLERDDRLVFWVRNPEVMPEEVQLQVFQRSFSTKGEMGRGLGTYSMRLLGERYLGGKVDFTSGLPEGTVFTFTFPKRPSPT